MGDETLRKMLRGAHATDAPSFVESGPCLNVAIGKISRHLFDIPAQFDDFEQGEIDLKTLLETAPSPGLLIVLGLPGGGAGLMSLDSLLVNALVELSTGASERTVLRESRVPTRIDTALCQRFCTHLLGILPTELAGDPAAPTLPSLAWDRTVTEAEKLAFALESGQYAQISGHINFQDGLRGGADDACLSCKDAGPFR